MNKLLIFATIIVSFILSSCNLSAKINWQTNVKKSFESAKKSNKLLLINFHTDWCTWCEKMKKDTYTDKKVDTLIRKNFIALDVNPEKSEEAKMSKEGLCCCHAMTPLICCCPVKQS